MLSYNFLSGSVPMLYGDLGVPWLPLTVASGLLRRKGKGHEKRLARLKKKRDRLLKRRKKAKSGGKRERLNKRIKRIQLLLNKLSGTKGYKAKRRHGAQRARRTVVRAAGMWRYRHSPARRRLRRLIHRRQGLAPAAEYEEPGVAYEEEDEEEDDDLEAELENLEEYDLDEPAGDYDEYGALLPFEAPGVGTLFKWSLVGAGLLWLLGNVKQGRR